MLLPRAIYSWLAEGNGRRIEADSFAPDANAAFTHAPNAVIDGLSALDLSEPDAALRLIAQCLAIHRSDLSRRLVDAEFVATMPSGIVLPARSTAEVIAEMLSSRPREVVAFGYEITDASFLVRLHDAARSAEAITLICDRKKHSGTAILNGWPASLAAPTIYEDVDRAGASEYASMHMKSLLVDGTDLLLTSANFTFHGHHENLEFGVRLRGKPALDAHSLYRQLLRSGLLEPL